MNNFDKRLIAPIILILALIVGAVVYFANPKNEVGSDTNDQQEEEQAEVSFKHQGVVTQNNPGLKPNTWYLIYEQPGSAALSRELNLNGQSYNLQKGMTVYVEGTEENNVVKVSALNILNAHKDDLIWVSNPLPNTTVTSPLAISGEARGGWYFEADFPVKLLDANGKVLAQGPAQAQGEWMTNNYVPFKATLTFAKPTTAEGTLVLEKSNPSGLPQNANELRIPVKFQASAAQMHSVKLYYYNSSKDKDSSGNVQCSKNGLVAVNRTITTTNTPIQDTIKLLLKGELTAAEKSQGITTEYPLPGLELKSANLVAGVLTLEFADPQNKTSGGACRANVLWYQIEATAKQFPGVLLVNYKPNTLFQP